MAEEKLMTEAEYDAKLRQWAEGIRVKSITVLRSNTHGKGKLAKDLTKFVDKMKDGEGRHIAFRFDQYGVFRQYGAGRGWVVVNGVPVPGYRVVSLKDRSHKGLWGLEALEMVRRGYSDSAIKSAKKVLVGVEKQKKREPLDWLDGNIRSGEDELADIAVQFHGDRILDTLGARLRAAQITKKK